MAPWAACDTVTDHELTALTTRAAAPSGTTVVESVLLDGRGVPDRSPTRGPPRSRTDTSTKPSPGEVGAPRSYVPRLRRLHDAHVQAPAQETRRPSFAIATSLTGEGCGRTLERLQLSGGEPLGGLGWDRWREEALTDQTPELSA